ncbi:MAG: diguanylate cyclase [Thioalkalivibrio sp.]
MHDEEARLAALKSYDILDTPFEESFDDFTRLIAHICEAPIAVINLVDRERQWFKSEIGLGVRETPLDISICKHAILQKGLFVVPDTTLDERFQNNPLVTGEPYLRFYAGALLETEQGLPLGTVCVLDYKPRQLTEAQADVLGIVSRQVMTALELRKRTRRLQEALARNEQLREDLEEQQRQLLLLNEKLELLATTDPLTGLHNRRVFEQTMKRQMGLFERSGVPFCLVLLDLDHFKEINDRHGHDQGDLVLQQVAGMMRPALREVDMLARIGGEEFAMILPDTDEEDAMQVAERLRREVAWADWETGPLTLCAGVAKVMPGDTGTCLFSAADKALYRAKDAGRNQVCVRQAPLMETDV